MRRRRRVTTSMINGFVAVDFFSRESPNVSSPRYGFILSPVRSFDTAAIVPVTKQNYGPVYTYTVRRVINRARDIELSLVAPHIRVTATGWDFQPTFSRILGDAARVFCLDVLFECLSSRGPRSSRRVFSVKCDHLILIRQC